MNELQKLMDEIAEWSDKTFGDAQRTRPILYHLKKEVDELIEAVEYDELQSVYLEKVVEEFADCFMLLLDAATHHQISADQLGSATLAKLEKNRNRKWGKPDENGVVEHIKDEPKIQLTSDDFIKVPSETECEGCYFVNRDHCQNDDLACEVWQDLNTCGTIGEGYIFKLKEDKQ